MPNLKEVRNRIGSVTSTRQITSAMKLVSAAKLRRAQEAIQKMRPYAEKLENILANLSENIDTGDVAFARNGVVKQVTVVVITSNRGLCGAFNSQIIKKAIAYIQEKYSSQYKAGNVNIVTIGKTASTAFTKRGYNVTGDYKEVYDNLAFEMVIPIAEKLMEDFSKGQTDKVEIFYNQFKSAATQTSTQENFLPLQPATGKKAEKDTKQVTDYIFEPSKEEIVKNLIPLSLKTTLFKAILDSYAAEHGARMTAMHKATDNAGELLKDLKLSYNKARQAAITNEILEIVAGAEALNG